MLICMTTSVEWHHEKKLWVFGLSDTVWVVKRSGGILREAQLCLADPLLLATLKDVTKRNVPLLCVWSEYREVYIG